VWHDSRASLLARNLASPWLGRKPKARIATLVMCDGVLNVKKNELKA